MALVGVVPARRYRSLAKQLEESRRSAHEWKTRAREALARVKSLESDVERQSRLVKDARTQAEKTHRAEEHAIRLRDQLAATQRELMLAREHLMAIEVKLDILEGAANVLDARTRTAIRQSPRTGAAV
jgi:hypothetical protein